MYSHRAAGGAHAMIWGHSEANSIRLKKKTVQVIEAAELTLYLQLTEAAELTLYAQLTEAAELTLCAQLIEATGLILYRR